MIRLLGPTSRYCDGFSRRELIADRGPLPGWLSLPNLLERVSAGPEASRSSGKARNCIILFLSGGASHHDTFDPSPTLRPRSAASSTRSPPPTGRPVLQVSARDGEADGSNRPDALDDTHIVGARDRRLCHVYRSDLCEDRERGEFHGASGSAAHRFGPGENRPGIGYDVPVILVPRRLDAGSGRRAGQWGGSLGQQVRPNANRRRSEPRRLPAREPTAPANAPRPVLQRRLGLVDQLNQQTRYLKETHRRWR